MCVPPGRSGGWEICVCVVCVTYHPFHPFHPYPPYHPYPAFLLQCAIFLSMIDRRRAGDRNMTGKTWSRKTIG